MKLRNVSLYSLQSGIPNAKNNGVSVNSVE